MTQARQGTTENTAFKDTAFKNAEFETQPEKKSGGFIDEIFLKHPRDAGENYFLHLGFTLWVAFYLVVTAICIVLHGLIPCIFLTTGSDRVRRLTEIMQARREKFMNSIH